MLIQVEKNTPSMKELGYTTPDGSVVLYTCIEGEAIVITADGGIDICESEAHDKDQSLYVGDKIVITL